MDSPNHRAQSFTFWCSNSTVESQGAQTRWVAGLRFGVTKHEPSRYRVVYMRPVDDCLDIQHGNGTYDRRTRQHIMRVSTHQDASPSWEVAREDAIWRMSRVDARYRRDPF